MTGSGAILLHVIGSPGRGDAGSQRIWNRLDTAVAYLLIVAGVLPTPFLFYRDISRQYGSLDRASAIPVALLDGEYTSDAFRIEGDRLYNVSVTLSPTPEQGAESSAQGVQPPSGQEVPSSVRLEYETVRLGSGEPTVWVVYKDPIEIGQKVWITLPWYDRFMSHVRVNLRFSQGGKSYSGVYPHLEITPCEEVGGRTFVGGPLRHQQSLHSAFFEGSPCAAAAPSRCHTTKRNMILKILNDTPKTEPLSEPACPKSGFFAELLGKAGAPACSRHAQRRRNIH